MFELNVVTPYSSSYLVKSPPVSKLEYLTPPEFLAFIIALA